MALSAVDYAELLFSVCPFLRCLARSELKRLLCKHFHLRRLHLQVARSERKCTSERKILSNLFVSSFISAESPRPNANTTIPRRKRVINIWENYNCDKFQRTAHCLMLLHSSIALFFYLMTTVELFVSDGTSQNLTINKFIKRTSYRFVSKPPPTTPKSWQTPTVELIAQNWRIVWGQQ